MRDIDIVLVDMSESPQVLDPKRPIREADIGWGSSCLNVLRPARTWRTSQAPAPCTAPLTADYDALGSASDRVSAPSFRFVEVLFRCVAPLAKRNQSFAFSRASFSAIEHTNLIGHVQKFQPLLFI